MAARHYDVILLGRSVGVLLAAALLARREFRVLVLGNGERPAHYRAHGFPLARRAFSLLGATSPVFRRCLQELAQTQRFRRLTTPLDPMFGVLDGALRFEVPPDVELFTREIDREMPEVAGAIGELYATISETNAAMDRAFEKEVVWPPGSLLERVETGQRANLLPLKSSDPPARLFERFPVEHPMLNVVGIPALFASHTGMRSSDLGALALTRLHGFWTRGVVALRRGEQDLEDFLVERIEAHGGVCRLRSRVQEIVVERGRAVGVVEEDDGGRSGADSIVCSLTGEGIADLARGSGITKQAEKSWPVLEVDGHRFVMSAVVSTRGIPAALPKEAFLIAPEPFLPNVHLQTFDCAELAEGRDETGSAESRLLVLETLLPAHGSLALLDVREAILKTVARYLPFVERHILALDSTHDGRPLRYRGAGDAAESPPLREMDRVHLKETWGTAEPMQPRFRPVEGYLGLSAEPLRGPVPGTFLVGPSVLPSLGQEGEMLAAQSVVRILTKKDRQRQKLRKRLWTKIETS